MYHEHFMYNGDYEEWQMSLIANKFPPGKSLVDLGCGSGSFSGKLSNLLGVTDLTLVDPYSGVGIPQTTMDFCCNTNKKFDCVLLKESLHHTPTRDLPVLFDKLFELTDGVCMVVTRPQYDIDYPFNDEMFKKWKNSQVTPYEYLDRMVEAGFRDCSLSVHTYDFIVRLEDWISMVRNRVWSIFGPDEEEYIEWLIKHFPRIIKFQEKLVIVTGHSELSSYSS